MRQSTINVSILAQEINGVFEIICADNPKLKLELSAKGELITLSPTSWENGRRNAKLTVLIGIWNESRQLGELFDSSTGFRLPNGGIRSPDVSWVANERLSLLIPGQTFSVIAPDFVLELMSQSDKLKDAQDKMVEYMEAGVRLGWLLNPQNKVIEIYYQNREKQILHNPTTLNGEDVLVGFVLNLAKIW